MQQEVAMNCKTIDEQNKELAERSWTEDQTQLLQQEVAANCKTIDEQNKEIAEKRQQLLTVRMEKEEQSMVARKLHREGNELMRAFEEELSKERTRMAIAYEHDFDQKDKVRIELDQLKSTIAKKDEQIIKLQQERDDILFEYEVRALLFVCCLGRRQTIIFAQIDCVSSFRT